jgi:hypothetical protein
MATLYDLEEMLDDFTPEKLGNSLFEFIKHGDAAHQEWLKEKSVEWAKKELTKYQKISGALLAFAFNTVKMLDEKKC